jgi:four helix bundle protein
MGKIQRFEEMDVWKLARELTRNIYSISNHRDFFRDFGLREQIRRASISIVSNIAEGFESQINPGFCRFLASARGSAAEIRAQLYLASDFHYITDLELRDLVSQTEFISRQLTGFINYLQSSSRKK